MHCKGLNGVFVNMYKSFILIKGLWTSCTELFIFIFSMSFIFYLQIHPQRFRLVFTPLLWIATCVKVRILKYKKKISKSLFCLVKRDEHASLINILFWINILFRINSLIWKSSVHFKYTVMEEHNTLIKQAIIDFCSYRYFLFW